MNWKIEMTHNAVKDLKHFKGADKKQIEKAILKVSSNPLPYQEGGYGKPLGNHAQHKLAGLLKIKLRKLGVRVIYKLIKIDNKMQIIVISIRDSDKCYQEAQKRIAKI